MADREDLVKRSLATPGEEAIESGAARRKSRFMASIADLKTDPAERARIESIAAEVGIADRAGNAPRAASTAVPLRRTDRDDLDPPDSARNRNRPIRRLIKRTGDFLTWVGGGHAAILEHLPQARPQFVTMGGILLTTAGFAVASMIFVLNDAVRVMLVPSVCLSLVWGLVVLNLNRFFIVSMGSTRDVRRLLLMALPRIMLSMLLALLISTPLTLRIFASDINSQLVVMQAQRSERFAALESTSEPQREANLVLAQVNTDKATLAGRLPEPITSPQLQAAQAQVSSLQVAAERDYRVQNDAYTAWQCELDGRNCAGGSGLAGAGPLAQEAYQEYLHALSTYNSTESQLTAAQNAVASAQASLRQAQATALSRYQAEAQASLPGLERQYQALAADLQATAAQDDRANLADTGILAQLQALSAASAQSPSLEAAQLSVLALFFVIELLPVAMKFLLNLGAMSSYERVARAQEIEAQKIEEERSRVRIAIEFDMQAREEQLGKRANEYVIAEMAKILDHALQEWGDEAYARLFPDGEHMDASVAKVIMETRPEIWEQLKAVS